MAPWCDGVVFPKRYGVGMSPDAGGTITSRSGNIRPKSLLLYVSRASACCSAWAPMMKSARIRLVIAVADVVQESLIRLWRHTGRPGADTHNGPERGSVSCGGGPHHRERASRCADEREPVARLYFGVAQDVCGDRSPIFRNDHLRNIRCSLHPTPPLFYENRAEYPAPRGRGWIAPTPVASATRCRRARPPRRCSPRSQ